jgi:hypothetical protein
VCVCTYNWSPAQRSTEVSYSCACVCVVFLLALQLLRWTSKMVFFVVIRCSEYGFCENIAAKQRIVGNEEIRKNTKNTTKEEKEKDVYVYIYME